MVGEIPQSYLNWDDLSLLQIRFGIPHGAEKGVLPEEKLEYADSLQDRAGIFTDSRF